MEKLRQKANTPEPKIMIRDENTEGWVYSQLSTPGPSISKAGTANMTVAKGAM